MNQGTLYKKILSLTEPPNKHRKSCDDVLLHVKHQVIDQRCRSSFKMKIYDTICLSELLVLTLRQRWTPNTERGAFFSLWRQDILVPQRMNPSDFDNSFLLVPPWGRCFGFWVKMSEQFLDALSWGVQHALHFFFLFLSISPDSRHTSMNLNEMCHVRNV